MRCVFFLALLVARPALVSQSAFGPCQSNIFVVELFDSPSLSLLSNFESSSRIFPLTVPGGLIIGRGGETIKDIGSRTGKPRPWLLITCVVVLVSFPLLSNKREGFLPLARRHTLLDNSSHKSVP